MSHKKVPYYISGPSSGRVFADSDSAIWLLTGPSLAMLGKTRLAIGRGPSALVTELCLGVVGWSHLKALLRGNDGCYAAHFRDIEVFEQIGGAAWFVVWLQAGKVCNDADDFFGCMVCQHVFHAK